MAKTDGILKLSAPIGADVLNVTDCISGNMRLIDAYATKLDGDIGNKDTLTTTNKTVVGAINEVNGFKSTVLDTLEEVAANTQVHKPAGALALKQANINLTNELVAKETKIANLQAQVARLNTDLSNTTNALTRATSELTSISNNMVAWNNPTFANGLAQNGHCFWRRFGNLVTFHFCVQNVPTGRFEMLYGMPGAVATSIFAFHTVYGAGNGCLIIDTNGTCVLDAVTSRANSSVDGSYICV